MAAANSSTATKAKKTVKGANAAASKKSSAGQGKRSTSAMSKSAKTKAGMEKIHQRKIQDVNEYKDRMAFETAITLIVMIIIAVFLYLGYFGLGGTVGKISGGLFFGIFGWSAWLLPAGVILGYIFNMVNHGDRRVPRKITSLVAAVWLLLGISDLVSGQEIITEYYTSNHVLHKKYFECMGLTLDNILNGGKGNPGIAGRLISSLFSKIAGEVGAVVIMIALFILCLFIFDGIELMAVIRKRNAYKQEMEDTYKEISGKEDYREPSYHIITPSVPKWQHMRGSRAAMQSVNLREMNQTLDKMEQNSRRKALDKNAMEEISAGNDGNTTIKKMSGKKTSDNAVVADGDVLQENNDNQKDSMTSQKDSGEVGDMQESDEERRKRNIESIPVFRNELDKKFGKRKILQQEPEPLFPYKTEMEETIPFDFYEDAGFVPGTIDGNDILPETEVVYRGQDGVIPGAGNFNTDYMDKDSRAGFTDNNTGNITEKNTAIADNFTKSSEKHTDINAGITGNIPESSEVNTGITGNIPENEEVNAGITVNIPESEEVNTGITVNIPESEGVNTGITGNIPESEGVNAGITGNIIESSGRHTGITNIPETRELNTVVADNIPVNKEKNTGSAGRPSYKTPDKTTKHGRIGGDNYVSGSGTFNALNDSKVEIMDIPPKEYIFPPVGLLSLPEKPSNGLSDDDLRATALKLQETLKSFNVNVKMGAVTCGPTVTRYELFPEQGVRVNKITNLADDLKLSLAAQSIRIEAPIPGKSAVGIEVPNPEPGSVAFRELLEEESFRKAKSPVTFAVGKDIAGKPIMTDIAKMPHLLIAGATGSGKSVCINTLIMSILYKANPDDVKLIMIDPKVVELSVYNGIPHLFCPVVTDAKEASAALNWAVREMMDRYNKFKELGVRNISGYNNKIKTVPEAEAEQAGYAKMPSLVIIVDEFADLMMVASKEVEDSVCRLAQLARAAGIHLVLATQRPSVNVITGVIKANIPSRIAFSVSSAVDSRTIIDKTGAEKLIGKGDMLFFPSGYSEPVRVQGAFVSDKEVSDVVEFLCSNNEEPEYNENVTEIVENGTSSAQEPKENKPDRDEYFEEAGRFVIESERAAAGQLQRRFSIGFNRAGRIIDQLYKAGVVGAAEGTKPRKILMTMNDFDLLLGKVPPASDSEIEETMKGYAESISIENMNGYTDSNGGQYGQY